MNEQNNNPNEQNYNQNLQGVPYGQQYQPAPEQQYQQYYQPQYQPQYQAPTPAPQSAPEQNSPKKKSKLPLIIGIVVAVVAALAIALVLLLGGSSGKSGGASKGHVHSWSEWEATGDGYCHKITFERECDDCGEVETKKGKKADHNFVTKMDTYNHWSECEKCGYTQDTEPHIFIDNKCECGIQLVTGTPIIPGGSENNGDEPLVGEIYEITIWVPYSYDYEEDYVISQILEQIDNFMADNPGIIIEANVECVTEADAGSCVIADVASAPDIYCFAQDQLDPLVQVGALAAPGGDIASDIIANNDPGSIAAASLNGTLYAYPMEVTNGYYLYYDKSIISDPSSLEAIIEDCNNAMYSGKSNYRLYYALDNAWYTSSFFFATGCESVWSTDPFGNFTGVYDTFNSEAGLVAMKGMQNLAQAPCYSSDAYHFNNAAAIVTGLWSSSMAEEHFGNNLGVCKLPGFTVDGETYQLGSFSGNTLMGVKPQSNSKKEAVLQLLAHYLISEECQIERYESLDYIPTNVNAQQSYIVQSNPHVAALIDQNRYATPQRIINSYWWEIAASLGYGAKESYYEYELWYYLEEYEEYINKIIG